MGKIRGTLCMLRHISTLPSTTNSVDKSFIFMKSVVEKGLAESVVTGLGAGGPRFKSGRPDQNISSQFLVICDYYFTSNLLLKNRRQEYLSETPKKNIDLERVKRSTQGK